MTATSEAPAQAQLRLRANDFDGYLWRNNNGACVDANDANGRVIRYGLGNDSKKINDVRKSSDLIGIMPIVIQPRHVGRTFGLFTAIEVKPPNWTAPRNDRERAQAAFLTIINSCGGMGAFATHEDHLRQTLEGFIE